MPFDIDRIRKEKELVLKIIEEWDESGHPVAVMQLARADADPPQWGEVALLCGCHWKEGETQIDVVGSDPRVCPHLVSVRTHVVARTRDEHPEWKSMTLGNAILDIFHRVQSNQYVGQHAGGLVYTQEVAELLERDHDLVVAETFRLRDQEKLDLRGRILIPYEPRFRFPIELEHMIAMAVIDVLGVPNGDAEQAVVAELERCVAEHGRFAHGRDAFGRFWPHIPLEVLSLPGENWVANAVCPCLVEGAGSLEPAGVAILKAIEQFQTYSDA